MSSPRLRAPPSSPTGDHPPAVAHDDGDLTEFLDRLNCVPTLRSPDHRIIPAVQQPPIIDFRAMVAGEISGALGEAGLFVVENHGISGELVSATSGSVNGRRGFDGEGEGEELWWCGGEEMAGEWSEGHLNFRCSMQCLWVETERVATTILQLLFNKKLVQQPTKAELMTTTTGSVLCLRRHASAGPDKAHDGPVRTNLLQTLMRRSNHHHHSLAVHIFQGAAGFSAYSKLGGWASFCIGADADVVVVVTAGDQIQAWSGGIYRQVIGTPIFLEKETQPISIAFLYCHSNSCLDNSPALVKSVSLEQQIMLVTCLIFFYHIVQLLFYV